MDEWNSRNGYGARQKPDSSFIGGEVIWGRRFGLIADSQALKRQDPRKIVTKAAKGNSHYRPLADVARLLPDKNAFELKIEILSSREGRAAFHSSLSTMDRVSLEVKVGRPAYLYAFGFGPNDNVSQWAPPFDLPSVKLSANRPTRLPLAANEVIAVTSPGHEFFLCVATEIPLPLKSHGTWDNDVSSLKWAPRIFSEQMQTLIVQATQGLFGNWSWALAYAFVGRSL